MRTKNFGFYVFSIPITAPGTTPSITKKLLLVHGEVSMEQVWEKAYRFSLLLSWINCKLGALVNSMCYVVARPTFRVIQFADYAAVVEMIVKCRGR
jgi:hypothetical protein